jgi:hypothetical protein
VLQSEYNFYLSPSRTFLPQSKYTFCLTLSKPSACVRGDHTFERGDHTSEREREYLFYRFTPTLSKKSVCGQLLIRSILVLLFSFEVTLKKKIIKKKLQQKKAKRNEKKQQQRRGFVCVFFSIVRWCFMITFVSRLTSLAQSSVGPAYYHR